MPTRRRKTTGLASELDALLDNGVGKAMANLARARLEGDKLRAQEAHEVLRAAAPQLAQLEATATLKSVRRQAKLTLQLVEGAGGRTIVKTQRDIQRARKRKRDAVARVDELLEQHQPTPGEPGAR